VTCGKRKSGNEKKVGGKTKKRASKLSNPRRSGPDTRDEKKDSKKKKGLAKKNTERRQDLPVAKAKPMGEREKKNEGGGKKKKR